ncbi:MAG: protease complex subunit PrcB family protein [Acidobacteria bacterium]|nr:protease complex subunit PrcB family protein [Acidobacteriota bacterium]
MTALLPALALAAVLQAGGAPGAMKTIAQGADSAVDEARQTVARTPVEWAALWRAHDFERPAPAVDFTTSMVVAVFMGSRPSAGFAVQVVGTTRDGNDLIVQYRETVPARGTLAAQILTSPYHLVSLPRVDGDVKFERVP